MNKREQIINTCLSISMLLLLAMAMLPLLKITWAPAPYVYAVGAVGAFVSKLFEKYKGSDPGLKRLYKLGKVSVSCYLMSAILMIYGLYYDPTVAVDWLAFLTAGATLQVYVSFRIAHIEKKEMKKRK